MSTFLLIEIVQFQQNYLLRIVGSYLEKSALKSGNILKPFGLLFT